MVGNIIELQRAVFLPAIAWQFREGSLLSEVVFTLFLYKVLLGASEADPGKRNRIYSTVTYAKKYQLCPPNFMKNFKISDVPKFQKNS